MPEAEDRSARGESGDSPKDVPSYALDELTWEEAARILERDPRLILPVGAMEQHGSHLPLGTNTFIVERLARDLSEEDRILRAPTFPYGVSTPWAVEFGGTATLRRKTLHRAINELLASWEDHGVDEFILLTAQRYEPHLDALLMALTQTSTTTVVDLHTIDVSDLVERDPAVEHAGEVETSLLLHLDPGRVRRGRIRDAPREAARYSKHLRGRMPTPPEGSRGVVGSPSLASAEKGRRVYERYLTRIRHSVLRSSALSAEQAEV